MSAQDNDPLLDDLARIMRRRDGMDRAVGIIGPRVHGVPFEGVRYRNAADFTAQLLAELIGEEPSCRWREALH